MKENERKQVEKTLLTYTENDIIKTVEVPLFGRVTFHMQNGKVVTIETTSTVKTDI